VARFDEDRVRAELAAHTRILVAPYTGPFKEGNHYSSGDEHYQQVGEPLERWANDRNLRLITVEGIHVGVTDEPGYGPSDISGLRQTTAYLDVNEQVLVLARLAGGKAGRRHQEFRCRAMRSCRRPMTSSVSRPSSFSEARSTTHPGGTIRSP
jgi:hypothetical protein